MVAAVRWGTAARMSVAAARSTNVGPSRRVVRKAVRRAMDLAKSAGARRCVPLRVSGAFHSPLMKPAGEKLAVVLGAIQFNPPKFKFVANVTGDFTSDPDEIRSLLIKQITNPVRWTDSIQKLADVVAGYFVPAVITDNDDDRQGYGYVAFVYDQHRWRGPGLPCPAGRRGVEAGDIALRIVRIHETLHLAHGGEGPLRGPFGRETHAGAGDDGDVGHGAHDRDRGLVGTRPPPGEGEDGDVLPLHPPPPEVRDRAEEQDRGEQGEAGDGGIANVVA